ncbi:cytochrome P450 [Mycolicibacter minnesotensis]
MTTISTPSYLLDQAKRRFTPTMNTIPGMGLLEKRLMNVDWPQRALATPPAGSDLKPILGDSGLPLLGHIVELFRQGPDFPLHLYNTRGPVTFADSPVLPSIVALGPDATQTIFTNKNKDYSQKGWLPVIGPFFNRGLMMLEFEEHMAHRRIMQSAFTRPRLASYVEDIDRVASAILAQWPTDDGRFLVYPAMKELTLDVASVVFMGHEPGSDHQLVTKVNRAFEQTTRAGGAIIRTALPPFKWWQGLQGRKLLEEYFTERVKERRNAEGTDILTVLCHTADEDGNSFSDADIVNHMIFLMMAAHDTTTSTVTTMIYHLAAHQQWQDRAREESMRLGNDTLSIEQLEDLATLDLVMDESLRLVTPLPFNMRQTVRDTDLLGHFVPAGTNVVTWPGMNHWLPELYTNPRQFDPERFLEPRLEHKKHRYAWAPFGGGAHKCIGMVFGRLEIKTVLHRLLRQYRIELAHPGYQPRWDYGGMPLPMDGMPITLRRL